MSRILFAGLGVMGGPMARHLVTAGHELRLFNRTHAKAERLASETGAMAFRDVTEAAKGAEALVTCVGNDADVEEVVNRALPVMGEGALFIDHTTASADLAKRLAERYPRIDCVDAPVSGGEAGAREGCLSIMCGGSEKAVARAEPIVAAYAKQVVRIGPAGHGQLAKMANQIAVAGVIEGLAEALHFGTVAGVDSESLIRAISGGAAQSWQMDNRARTMTKEEFDFGFAVDLMRKDLGLVLAEARANGATLPVTALVDQFYADVQRMGGGRNDTSALIRRLQ